tara:strand:- start:13851 stop:16463 length:2613 start_codon:yes stop_codon:yes gene_type:complete
MKNLEYIADELFNKIRGRYPSVTVGDNDATITNMPKQGRFFEFDFQPGKKVSISLDEDGIAVMYSTKLFDSNDASLKSNWFRFLKELRLFAKKRMLNFDTRDITKNSLDKRDYEYLSTEKQMSESKLYGTSRTSFQDIGSAKMIVKHSQPINREQPAGRTRDIAGIYIESESGERFKYPMKHLNGARAMSMHVAEGGTPYDDFGKHIIGLSEELSKLRKFKTYMNRSSVMAEGLAGYMDIVNERIEAVKKTTHALQSKAKYQEAFKNFDNTVLEEVPEDVSNSWIDELTIKQFNEELKGVFPYIYKLVSEANKVKDLGPEDLIGEGFDPQEFKGVIKGFEVSGDDGEEEGADIHYTAKIVDGKPVVDPKSIKVHAYGNNPSSKLGYDVDNDTDMIMNYGGVDAEEILRSAQEDAEEEWNNRDNKYAHGEDVETEGAVKGMVMDMEDDAADMSRDEFIEKYGRGYADIWDKVNDEDYMDPDYMSPESYDFEPIADDIISGAKFNQETPMTEYERAFEDFKMAAANAAAKGEKDFEYPKGSGKKHPTKMDKATAAKLLADSQTNEDDAIALGTVGKKYLGMYKTHGADYLAQVLKMDKATFGKEMVKADGDPAKLIQNFLSKRGFNEAQQLDELAFLPFLIPAASVAMRGLMNPAVRQGAMKGGKAVVGWALKNPVKATVGTAAATNPIDTKNAVVGAVDGAKKLKKGIDDAGELVQNAKKAVSDIGNKIPTKDDLIKLLPGVPNLGGLASIARQYALPAAVVAALALGGVAAYKKLFGGKKEGDDQDTVDLSPKGQGDELKGPQETPLDEFVKSMYDYTQNAFPKGETAVLTSVQKKYGDKAVPEAGKMIDELLAGQDSEMARIQALAGLR